MLRGRTPSGHNEETIHGDIGRCIDAGNCDDSEKESPELHPDIYSVTRMLWASLRVFDHQQVLLEHELDNFSVHSNPGVRGV